MQISVKVDVGIPVDIERNDCGLYFGTSKVVRGLFIVGDTADEIESLAPLAIAELCEAATKDNAQTGG